MCWNAQNESSSILCSFRSRSGSWHGIVSLMKQGPVEKSMLEKYAEELRSVYAPIVHTSGDERSDPGDRCNDSTPCPVPVVMQAEETRASGTTFLSEIKCCSRFLFRRCEPRVDDAPLKRNPLPDVKRSARLPHEVLRESSAYEVEFFPSSMHRRELLRVPKLHWHGTIESLKHA